MNALGFPWFALGVLGLAGCTEYTLGGGSINAVAVTLGDFDDVREPLNRMVVGRAEYEGIISTATWDPSFNHGAVALKVEGLLRNYGEMALNDAIFVASGTRGLGVRQYNGLEADDHLVADPQVIENVRGYVSSGRTLLVTDWSYDLIEAAWPDAIDFLNDDTVIDDAQRGEIGTVVANVVDDTVARDLDSDTMTLRFNYSNWAVIDDVGPDTRVLMRGDATYRVPAVTPDAEVGWVDVEDIPLMVAFRPSGGSGQVIFLSFHIDAQNAPMVDQLLRTVVGDFQAGEVDREGI